MIDYNFLFNRLLRMSPLEVTYRLFHKIIRPYDNKRIKTIKIYHEEVDRLEMGYEWIPLINQEFIDKADKLTKGYFDIFAIKDCFIGGEIDYHKDYKNQKRTPDDISSDKISISNNEKYGDIKYIWELNRQYFILQLAVAYTKNKEVKYLDSIKRHIRSWMDQNPFFYGANWYSSLEVAIRLINWSISWKLINKELEKDFENSWIDVMYQSCRFINSNFSRFSSANNHIIGEAAGLYIGASILPQTDLTDSWLERSLKILEKEIKKQTYDDGINKEQASAYQLFVLDFLLLVLILSGNNPKPVSSRFVEYIEKMMDYLKAIEDQNGGFPLIGDSDDGMVIDLCQAINCNPLRSILNTGAYLFGRKDLIRKGWDSNKDLKTWFLLGLNTKQNYYQEPQAEKPFKKSFIEGGYYILGKNINENLEQKLIFDCGPLGYLSLAAHGHSDALSFVFYAGGWPVFVDSGTYTYHGSKEWREYFRSTRAHNTIVIDGRSQSITSGDFMWSKKARAKKIGYQENNYVEAAHYGYSTIFERIIHSRKIIFNSDDNLWSIIDSINSRKQHKIEACFHLHPTCKIESWNNKMEIYCPRGKIIFYPDQTLKVKIKHGCETPITGWYSESYDQKEPTPTIFLETDTNGPVEFVNRFSFIPGEETK